MKLLACLKGPFIDFFIFLKLSWKLSHIFQTIMIFIGLRKFFVIFYTESSFSRGYRVVGNWRRGAFSNLLIKQEINSLVFMLIS